MPTWIAILMRGMLALFLYLMPAACWMRRKRAEAGCFCGIKCTRTMFKANPHLMSF